MNKLISAASPHFHRPRTTRTIMLDVIIALAPAMIASVIFFGWRSMLVIADCVAVCMLSEWGFEKLCKKEHRGRPLGSGDGHYPRAEPAR